MLLFDTNVLVYAVDEDSPFHEPCRERVSRARSDASPAFLQVLTATSRHSAVLAQTVAEHPDACGNLAHDLHTAALMREYGISRICTRDADFHRFPFLTVVDPLR